MNAATGQTGHAVTGFPMGAPLYHVCGKVEGAVRNTCRCIDTCERHVKHRWELAAPGWGGIMKGRGVGGSRESARGSGHVWCPGSGAQTAWRTSSSAPGPSSFKTSSRWGRSGPLTTGWGGQGNNICLTLTLTSRRGSARCFCSTVCLPASLQAAPDALTEELDVFELDRHAFPGGGGRKKRPLCRHSSINDAASVSSAAR